MSAKKSARARSALPLIARTLEEMGSDIRLARQRRRWRQKDFAAILSVSVDTVRRLEAGDAGISIGVLCRACLALGHIRALQELIRNPEQETHFLLDAPLRRVRRPARKVEEAPAGTETGWEKGWL